MHRHGAEQDPSTKSSPEKSEVPVSTLHPQSLTEAPLKMDGRKLEDELSFQDGLVSGASA